MNRELKFRAWVTRYDEPEMMYLESFKNWYDCEYGFLLGFSKEGYSGIGAHELYEEDTKATQFHIMQWTGKRCYANENDFRELYEGDIVETVYGAMQCVWNDDKCCYQIENKDRCFDFHQIDITTQPIIGNIHETPDLLK